MKILLFLTVLVLTRSVLSQERIERTVWFKNGSSELNIDGIKIAKEIAHLIIADKVSYIRIFAYSTSSGPEESNFLLSKSRAYSIYNRINSISKIDESKFYMTWLVESDDTYDLHYEKANAQKACADIVVKLKPKVNGS